MKCRTAVIWEFQDLRAMISRNHKQLMLLHGQKIDCSGIWQQLLHDSMTQSQKDVKLLFWLRHGSFVKLKNKNWIRTLQFVDHHFLERGPIASDTTYDALLLLRWKFSLIRPGNVTLNISSIPSQEANDQSDKHIFRIHKIPALQICSFSDDSKKGPGLMAGRYELVFVVVSCFLSVGKLATIFRWLSFNLPLAALLCLSGAACFIN